MSEQLDMDLARKPQARAAHPKDDLSAELRFLEFHRWNPQVYAELARLARQLKARGHQHGSIKLVWEVARWNAMMRTNDIHGDGWKLNNNWHSRYARLLMDCEPDLAGFFETRVLGVERAGGEE